MSVCAAFACDTCTSTAVKNRPCLVKVGCNEHSAHPYDLDFIFYFLSSLAGDSLATALYFHSVLLVMTVFFSIGLCTSCRARDGYTQLLSPGNSVMMIRK